MKSMELISGFVTAPSTTLTGLTMASGNSLTVRAAREDSGVKLIGVWADNQATGVLRIRSPRMHDNVQCMRFPIVVGNPQSLFPRGMSQKLYPQDTLTVELSGSATAGDIESACLLIYYDDLPGVNANLINKSTLKSRATNIITVENTLALGTSGGYSGEEAINAEYDLLKANTDYAIIGYLVSAGCAAIRWRGVDFGNLGIGAPGQITDQTHSANFFVRLAEDTGLDTIPVFNSANKASLLLDGVQDNVGTDVSVSTILAELS